MIHLPVNEFRQIGYGCLRAEPAAPDPAKKHRDEKKNEDHDQHGNQKQVQLFNTDSGPEKEERAGCGIQPEQRIAADAHKGKYQKKYGGDPLKKSSFWCNTIMRHIRM